MSEEEKKVIKDCKMSLATFMFSGITEKDKILFKAKEVETLLNLIDKQQKEIEELKTALELKVDMVYNKNMPEHIKMILMYRDDFNRNFGNDYISKDKIREVLEKERKKQKERDDISLALHSQYISLIDKIKKQLLEE